MTCTIRAACYSLLVCLCASAFGSETASTSPPETLLNSERIAAKFGNYALELVSQNSTFRISNLYSEDQGTQTTRTIAVVDFLTPVASDISDLHQAVWQGQSIGATFKSHGWIVHKQNLAFKDININILEDKYRKLMRINSNQNLATHLYLLQLSKTDRPVIDYALIAELHHPEYLSSSQIKQIYGDKITADTSYLNEVERIFNALSGQ